MPASASVVPRVVPHRFSIDDQWGRTPSPFPLLASVLARWDPRASVALPDGEVFYLVALLRFNRPPPEGPSAEELVTQNQEVVDTCAAHGYDFRLYLPHHGRREQWRRHFGEQWPRFAGRKARYDPLGILSPGQRIFSRSQSPFPEEEDV